MANVETREFRHLRKERGGKALVSSLHNRKAIQLAARRIVYVEWPVATTTFSLNGIICEFDYKVVDATLYRYIGRELQIITVGKKTFKGVAGPFDYKLSREYRDGVNEIFRTCSSYGTLTIESEGHIWRDLPVATRGPITINTETVYDKSGKPRVVHIENKNDWSFKNDVETDFDR